MSETQDAQIRNTIPANIAKPLSDAFVRIFRNSADGLYYGKRFNGTIELIGAVGPSTDERVKVRSTDTIAGFLADKIVAGSNIGLIVLNPGGDEKLEINAPGTFAPAFGHIYSLGSNQAAVNPGQDVPFPLDASFIGADHPTPETLRITESGFYRIAFYIRQSSPSSEVEILFNGNSFSTGSRFLATSTGDLQGSVMYGAFTAPGSFSVRNVGTNPFTLADTGSSVNAWLQIQKLG